MVMHGRDRFRYISVQSVWVIPPYKMYGDTPTGAPLYKLYGASQDEMKKSGLMYSLLSRLRQYTE